MHINKLKVVQEELGSQRKEIANPIICEYK